MIASDSIVKTICGIEAQRYEDDRFTAVFYLKPGWPVYHGLYGLELWDKATGKVLNVAWASVKNRELRIASFRRGDWETAFLRLKPTK